MEEKLFFTLSSLCYRRSNTAPFPAFLGQFPPSCLSSSRSHALWNTIPPLLLTSPFLPDQLIPLKPLFICLHIFPLFPTYLSKLGKRSRLREDKQQDTEEALKQMLGGKTLCSRQLKPCLQQKNLKIFCITVAKS